MTEVIKRYLIFWFIPVGLLFLWYFQAILMPFLVGLIIGSAIQSLAYYLNYRFKINYHLAVFLIYYLSLSLIVFVFYSIINILISEAPSLITKLNNSSYFKLLKSLDLKTKWEDLLNPSNYLSNLPYVFSNFLESFISLILILVVSLYISLSKSFPENFFHFLKLKEDYFTIWRHIRRKLAFWFFGQIVLMFVIGLAVYIFVGLVLKVKYALLVSLVAGILEVVPILGPIVSAVLVSFVVFLENPAYVLPSIIFFILIQQLENHLLVPLVMSKAVNLHPVLVILGILIGGKFGGILGIILILPLLGVFIEIMNFAGSSNGRTSPSGGEDPGSSPGPAMRSDN